MRALFTTLFIAIVVDGAVGLAQAPAPQWPAWKIEKISNDIYVIFGEGGNTTAYLTDEGVVLVDVKFERNYDDIQTRIKTLTDKLVKYVFNTHAHGDHTGGNPKFLPSATIISHRNARAAMVSGKLPGPAQVTFTDSITINL